MAAKIDITDPRYTSDDHEYCNVLMSYRNENKNGNYRCDGAFPASFGEQVIAKVTKDCTLCVTDYFCSHVELTSESHLVRNLA